MTEEEIYEALTEIFRSVLDDDEIKLTPQLAASDVEEWDSLNHINIIVGSEIRFNIRFNVGEVEALSNVGDFVALVMAKMAD